MKNMKKIFIFSTTLQLKFPFKTVYKYRPVHFLNSVFLPESTSWITADKLNADVRTSHVTPLWRLHAFVELDLSEGLHTFVYRYRMDRQTVLDMATIFPDDMHAGARIDGPANRKMSQH